MKGYDLERTVRPSADWPGRGRAAGPPCLARPRPRNALAYRTVSCRKTPGEGGFGLVYLALDEQLTRPVAVKVPHARLIARPADAEAYLAEARTVAHLDHPNIVPVFDVGSTEQFPCYVVSKFIDGTDLATRLRQTRLPLREAAELVQALRQCDGTRVQG